MGFEFARPWLLLLLPVALALTWWGWLAPSRRFALSQPGATPSSRRRSASAAYTNPLIAARRKPTFQHTASSALRAVILTLCILAVAGVSWRYTSARQSVVFAVDVSASVSGGEATTLAFMREAEAARGPDDQTAVVAIGETAMADAPLRAGAPSGPITSDPGRGFTNLAEGLRLAASLLPQGSRPRAVLITDGHENMGNAVEQARSLAHAGIRVDVVPLEPNRGTEVMVSDVRVPPYAFTGEEVPITANLRATAATGARVRLYAGQTQVGEQQMQLLPGLNQVSFKVPAGSQGFQTYRVEVEADSDALSENNADSGISRISGTPSVLVVRREPNDAAAIRGALTSLGIVVEERGPETVPTTVEQMQPFAAVILVNLPAHLLSEQVMTALEVYVRETGGGLMMVGGDESFGPGEYQGTPVERALPVYMDVKGQGEIPSLGLVLVIDKSRSMSFVPRYGTPAKLELAKEASSRTADVLSEQDMFGVIGFDEAAGWVVNLGPVTDKVAMQQAIAGILPGGGTNIHTGLELAYGALRGALVKSKHIILLTDGVSAYGGDSEKLAREMREAGITMSVVAVGQDSDVLLLQQMARWGMGRFYYTESGDNVPTIFAKETVLATRSYMNDEPFSPVAGSNSPLLKGIDRVPDLLGYIATRPKEAAEVALLSGEQEPVLAHWQYGLGRAIAWTPDLTGRWARPWIGTAELQQLLSNSVSWMMRPDDRGDLRVTARPEAGRVSILVETTGDEGIQATRARVTDPGLNTVDVALRATAPGEYAAEMPAQTPGAYLIQVEQQRPDGTAGQTGAGFVVPYSPEYRVVGVNWPLLRQIAAAGLGEVLTEPAQSFADNLASVPGRVPLWPWLLGLATLLWPLDVALRRLVIRWAPAQAWLQERLQQLRKRQSVIGPALSQRVLARREQQRWDGQERQPAPVREVAAAPEDEPAASVPPATREAPTARREGQPATGGATVAREAPAATTEAAASAPPRAPGPSPAPAGRPESHASRLLAAKRRRQEEAEEGKAG